MSCSLKSVSFEITSLPFKLMKTVYLTAPSRGNRFGRVAQTSRDPHSPFITSISASCTHFHALPTSIKANNGKCELCIFMVGIPKIRMICDRGMTNSATEKRHRKPSKPRKQIILIKLDFLADSCRWTSFHSRLWDQAH